MGLKNIIHHSAALATILVIGCAEEEKREPVGSGDEQATNNQPNSNEVSEKSEACEFVFRQGALCYGSEEDEILKDIADCIEVDPEGPLQEVSTCLTNADGDCDLIGVCLGKRNDPAKTCAADEALVSVSGGEPFCAAQCVESECADGFVCEQGFCVPDED